MAKPVPPYEVRRITDPRALRAMAHPTRMALLDLLHAEGPLTASQCGERLGESAASCSYHLRQLARYGHVHPAGGGRGRERPWRPRSEGISWGEPDASPAEKAAGRVLAEVVDDYRFGSWRRFRDSYEGEAPEWQDATISTDMSAWLTADELTAVAQAIYDAWRPYVGREAPEQRPPQARAVRFFAYAYPGSPPTAPPRGDTTTEGTPQ